MKFKSLYPNKQYEGCFFNSKCEFETASEKQAEKLRKSRLFAEHDIWEVSDEPAVTSDENTVIGGENIEVIPPKKHKKDKKSKV